MIDVIRAEGVADATVLDIGAGVDAIHTALVEAGTAKPIDVDASREYLANGAGGSGAPRPRGARRVPLDAPSGPPVPSG